MTVGSPTSCGAPVLGGFPRQGADGPRWRRDVASVPSVVSTSKEDIMFTRIVVGIDCRAGGRDALALAAGLQAAGGGELVAVHACASEPLVREDVVGLVEAELGRAGATGRVVVA